MGKDTIKKWILSHLSIGKRGFKSKFDFTIIILLIFKRLKTGCQWRELPVEIYAQKQKMSWEIVYYYFNKWSKDGGFRRVWVDNEIRNPKHNLERNAVFRAHSKFYEKSLIKKR